MPIGRRMGSPCRRGFGVGGQRVRGPCFVCEALEVIALRLGAVTPMEMTVGRIAYVFQDRFCHMKMTQKA